LRREIVSGREFRVVRLTLRRFCFAAGLAFAVSGGEARADFWSHPAHATGKAFHDAGKAIAKGAHATGNALKKGAHDAGHFIKKGTHEVGNGIERGAHDARHALEKAAH
jgi:hypothetical protein